MARQKDTLEARILEYFRTAPPREAGLVFGLVSAIMRPRRIVDEVCSDVGEKRRPGRPRKTPQAEVVE